LKSLAQLKRATISSLVNLEITFKKRQSFSLFRCHRGNTETRKCYLRGKFLQSLELEPND
jgi:hypothetical protein